MSASIVQAQPITVSGPTAQLRGDTTEQLWLEGFRVVAAALASLWCLRLVPVSSLYAAAAAAALCVMVGLYTHAAAALLALLLVLSPHALDPWHALDAPVLAFVALWLALLPIGRRFALDAKRRRKAAESTGVVPQLFTLQLVFLYADSAASHAARTWIPIQPASLLAAAIPAALFLARSGPLLAIPAALQLAFHCDRALHGGHYLANALLASSTAVFLRHLLPTPDAAHDARNTRALVLDARSAVALAWTSIALVALLAPILHLSLPYEIVRTVLDDLGWLGRLHGAP